ncbi:hypothetical protein B9Q04_14720 [Candidatus Marsarchaeota G2 archaeon BE_D]|uniref:FAD/NAD(P)-binding domain-containing protein n=1 Tax=Candidatus Marsarchaeota G2 archaeon BE_D TaxID=1978158 RepID=A0A2R6C7H8_9ARCH|nr:MAG: hypothetical protein B9Q04_14720 [Candidatus Marsarchaeota G2 archaeon BE_D]
MMPDTWDIAILGKGAAAFAAAIKASEKSSGKARIVMVGSGPIGGTCVNVGCVPSSICLRLLTDYTTQHGRFFPVWAP